MGQKAVEVTKVHEIMTQKVVCLHKEDSLFDATYVLNHYHLSSVPVIDENNRVVGILTEGDCLKALGSGIFYDEIGLQDVAQVMSRKIEGVRSSCDIFELEKYFVDHRLRHAPVVSPEGHLLGIVSRRDILIALEKLAMERLSFKADLVKPRSIDLSIGDAIYLASHHSA